MEWFRLLNSSIDSLFGKKIVLKGAIPVCSEGNGYKEYGIFRTPLILYDYCISLIDEKRCMYEVIRANIYQKIYFDVDLPLNEKSGETNYTIEQKKSIANQIPELMIDSIIKVKPEIQRTDILIFTSHSDEKRSFHVVVDRWCVSNAGNNRKFFDETLKYVPVGWRQFFDASMYKGIQYFRLYMSTKYGKNRMKILNINVSPWKPLENFTPNECNRQVFLSSLITRTDNCILLPFDENEETREYNEIDLLESEVPKLIKIIKNMPYSRCFAISERKNNLVVMRRLLPSYCNICLREHQSDNPFITVISNGDVNYNCRRNTDKKSIKIGNIYNENEITQVKKMSIEISYIDAKKETINEELFSPISTVSNFTRTSSFSSILSHGSSDNLFLSPVSSVDSPNDDNSNIYTKIGNRRRNEMKKRNSVGTMLSTLV